MQNTATQNHPRSVAFYYTWPGNEVSLLYNAPQSTWGKPKLQYTYVKMLLQYEC